MSYRYLFLFLPVVGLFGCKGCSEPKEKKVQRTPSGFVLDNPANHSPEFIAEVENGIVNYLEAMASGNSDRIIEAYFAPSFIGANLEEVKNIFDEYGKRGMLQRLNSTELRYLSTMIDTLGMQFVVVRYYADQELYFNENYEGNPEIFRLQFENRYGKDNVSYNPDTRTFRFTPEVLGYVARYRDDTAWSYLEDGFNTRVKSAVFPPELIKTLRIHAKYN